MDTEINEDDITHEKQRSVVESEYVSTEDFFQCDESVLTRDYRIAEQIYEDLENETTTSDDESEVEETENEILSPSYKEATSALCILRRYVVSSNVENDTFNILDNLIKRIMKTRPELNQLTLFDFFKN